MNDETYWGSVGLLKVEAVLDSWGSPGGPRGHRTLLADGRVLRRDETSDGLVVIRIGSADSL